MRPAEGTSHGQTGWKIASARSDIRSGLTVTSAALVFLALFALDFVWARYTFALSSRQSWRAASYASVIIFLSGGAAVGYVNDPVLLIPAMIGAFAGTFVAVRVA